MKKSGFLSNLAYSIRKRMGWCPKTPSPKGFGNTLLFSQQVKGGRPDGVTALFLLNIIGGSIAVILGLIFAAIFSRGIGLGATMGMFASILIPIGAILMFTGLLSVWTGWAIWKGAGWTWTLNVYLAIPGIIYRIAIAAHGLIRGNAILACGLIYVPLDVLILYYLLKPDVKAWFYRPLEGEHVATEGINVPELYGKLQQAYAHVYGGNNWFLEDKIRFFTDRGLSREEAIHKLAEKERLFETG